MAQRARITLALLMISGLASLGPTCSQQPEEASQTAAEATDTPVIHEVELPGFKLRYQQVASRRISRTLFEYDYEVTLQNNTAAAVDVSNVRVQSIGPPTTTVVDDEVVFSSLIPPHPGGTVTSSDPFTVAQDRTQPFAPFYLQFSVFSGPAGPCREKLFIDKDVIAADDLCALAVAANPGDGEARFFRAITRLLRVSEEQVDGPDPNEHTDSVKEMEDQFGLSPAGRTVYGWEATLDRDMADDVNLPADSPAGPEMQTALEGLLLPAIDASIADLQAFPGADSFFLGQADLDTIGDAVGTKLDEDTIEIDKGDARAIESALLLLKARFHELLAVDADFDIDDTLSPLTQKTYCEEDVLNPHPLLLTPRGSEAGPNLAAAKQAFRDSIDAYLAGSDFIRAEVDPQDDDLFTIEPDQLLDEEEIRLHLADLSASLDAQTCVFARGTTLLIDEADVVEALNNKLEPTTLFTQALLDLSLVYDASYSFRPVTPYFHDGCRVADGDFPDKAFGGVLVPAACGSP